MGRGGGAAYLSIRNPYFPALVVHATFHAALFGYALHKIVSSKTLALHVQIEYRELLVCLVCKVCIVGIGTQVCNGFLKQIRNCYF